MIVNIDETLFSRSTKINYSWTKRGIEWAVNNSAFVGSISLITNKGDWFVSNLLSQNNSDYFILFIEKLMEWLHKDLDIHTWMIVLMMDNCRIHTSKKCMGYLNFLGCKIILLSPYSPEYVPIELLFNLLKQTLSFHWKDLVVNLKKKEGKSR